MIKMGISTKSIKQLNREIEETKVKYRDKVADVLNNGIMDIHRTASSNIANQISVITTFRQNLQPEFKYKELEGNVHHVSRYAPYVEFGTKRKFNVDPEYAEFAGRFKGGSGGTFKQLVQNIEVWARKAGIPNEAVFPIALSIAKNGIPAKPFLYPAFDTHRSKIINNIKAIKKLTK